MDLETLVQHLVPLLRAYFIENPTSASYTFGNTIPGGNASIELGFGGSGNRYAYIDLIGDDTYTDFAFRIIRNNGGANSNSELSHRGTGVFALNAVDGGRIEVSSSAFNWATPPLLNSWVHWGGGVTTPGYYKDIHNRVHLKGLLKNGTVGAAMFVLPVGFRPTTRHHFPVMSNNGNTPAAVFVDPNGEVVPYNGSNIHISLDNISFRTDA